MVRSLNVSLKFAYDEFSILTVSFAGKKCFLAPTLLDILTQKYQDLFEAILHDGDYEKAQSEFSKVYESQGMDVSDNKIWLNSFKDLIDLLKSCQGSSSAEKAELAKAIENYEVITNNWTRKQPGLSDFPDSPKLRADPRNDKFFKMHEDFQDSAAMIVEDPKAALALFNEALAADFASFDFLVIEVSRRAVAMGCE